MSALERALAAPPPSDPTLLGDVEARLAMPRTGPRVALVVGAVVVVVGVIVGLAVFAGDNVRIAPPSTARARLALLAVDDNGASRPLLSGDVLKAGEGVVPGVVVVRPDAGRSLLVAAVEEDSGVVTWLAPREGCPAAGSAPPAVAVPRGSGAFRVVLVDVAACDAAVLEDLTRALPQRSADERVIDVVDLDGVR